MRKTSRPPEELEAALAEHAGLVMRVAHSYARTAEDRQDLAQEIRFQIVRAFPTWDPSRKLTTWMYRVALNTALTWRRKADRWRTSDVDWEALPAPSPEPLDEKYLLLRRLMEQLDPLNRALLVLHLDDQSHADIAEILGITPANVATKLTRIRQELRALADAQRRNDTELIYGTH